MSVERKWRIRGRATRAGTAALLALTMAAVAACGGDAKSGTVATNVPATPTARVQATPDELGGQIGALYVRALSDVTDLLREKPPASEAKASVAQLKETYVQRLVELGRSREALDVAGRASVDAVIRAKLDAIAGEPWYATYDRVVQFYFAEDEELHALIVSFNVIGQYANFDLLRSQEPGEAKRLLVE